MRKRKKEREKEREAKLFEIPNYDFIDALTWTCHICKENRPDAKISVLTKVVESLSTFDTKVTENIRYCNDRPECAGAAKTYSHFHLSEENDGADSDS